MNQGYKSIIQETAVPASPEHRELVRENFRVLNEISKACKSGDAELVKRLSALLVLPE
jgi:hypothetical protein